MEMGKYADHNVKRTTELLAAVENKMTADMMCGCTEAGEENLKSG